MGVSLASSLEQEDLKAVICFTDGLSTNGEEFLKGLGSLLPNVVLAGGMAADNGLLEETFIFTNNFFTSSGCVGVALSSSALHIDTRYSFDWTPIGIHLEVTKSVKHRVYEIEGMNVIDVYAKYFGYELARQLPNIGVEFPLIFEKDGVQVGRAVLAKHSDGSLTFAGNIEEGTKVRFGVGSVEKILQSSHYNIHKMVNELSYKTEATFIYSCMARRRFMDKDITQELEILNKIGTVSGFFTYGEFYCKNGKNQLLNETMTLLTLSESNEAMEKVLVQNRKIKAKEGVIKPEHVIANLANRVSSELEELNRSLEQRIAQNTRDIYEQAYFDKLTKLPNRLSLIQSLDGSIGKMIFLLNINDFTSINDFYGHEIGDGVLKSLGFLLKKYSKFYSCEVFKLPSDEFAVITTVVSEGLEEKIESYIKAIEEEVILVDSQRIHVNITLGGAMINHDNSGLIHADMALKLAKKLKQDYYIFENDKKLSQVYANNLSMASIIRKAIEDDKIAPFYQPLLNLKTGKIDKYEALVRLEKEDGKILSPFAFLTISEKIKLYPRITEIMIEKSFAYFSNKELSFSINLSFSDVLNHDIRVFLFEKIKEYDIASKLTIELLETQENQDIQTVNTFIEAVYTAGANIAIDDFGSGYANFEHMTSMRSDFMKIDGSLIKHIDSDANARLIVETIIIFAQKLGKKIVAEFVHSEEVYTIVKAMGVDYLQGYYIGEPRPEII